MYLKRVNSLFTFTSRTIQFYLKNKLYKKLLNQNQNDHFIFFSPESSIHPHFLTTLLIANSLKKSGINPLITNCDSVFDFCPVMQMNKLKYNHSYFLKTKICLTCRGFSQIGYSHFNLFQNSLKLSDFIPNQKVLDEILKNKILDTDFVYDSIPFGKIAELDMLFYKKSMFITASNPEHKIGLELGIRSAIKSYLATLKMIDQYHPKAIVHFNDYSIMTAATLAAKKRRIPSLTITNPAHNGVDRTKVMIMNEHWGIFHDQLLKKWPDVKHLPISPENVKQITADLDYRFQAKSIHHYSPKSSPNNPMSELGLSKNKPLFVVYTSSPDEMVVAKKALDIFSYQSIANFGPFENQIQWLTSLVEFFKNRDDIQCVIRIHPREGVNRRDSQKSEHLTLLKQHLRPQSNNLIIVWPESSVSSYDLAKHASVALTAWSNMTVELARLGVKTLSTSSDFSYPTGDFVEFSTSQADYFDTLNKLLHEKQTLSSITYAYRWYYMTNLAPCIDISEVIDDNHMNTLPNKTVINNIDHFISTVTENITPLTRDLNKRLRFDHNQLALEKNEILLNLKKFGQKIEHESGSCPMTNNIKLLLESIGFISDLD